MLLYLSISVTTSAVVATTAILVTTVAVTVATGQLITVTVTFLFLIATQYIHLVLVRRLTAASTSSYYLHSTADWRYLKSSI